MKQNIKREDGFMTADPIKFKGGCANCPQTEDKLSLNEVLYNGFGGYRVEKDDKVYYQGDPNGEWKSFKTLKDIEKIAKKEPNAKWKVILDNPLRGAIWEREKGEWVLKETNQGFA